MLGRATPRRAGSAPAATPAAPGPPTPEGTSRACRNGRSTLQLSLGVARAACGDAGAVMSREPHRRRVQHDPQPLRGPQRAHPVGAAQSAGTPPTASKNLTMPSNVCRGPRCRCTATHGGGVQHRIIPKQRSAAAPAPPVARAASRSRPVERVRPPVKISAPAQVLR